MSRFKELWERHRTMLRMGLILAAAVAIPLGYGLWYELVRRGPSATFDDPVENFKYGSFGHKWGLPYYFWQVMPEVFADKLPGDGGWKSFGFEFEAGTDYPVGFALQTTGFPGLSPNCALCHAGSYRTNSASKAQLVLGAPPGRLDFKGFVDFVLACGNDPRWSAEVLLPAIERRVTLRPLEREVYRRLLIPGFPLVAKFGGRMTRWMDERPAPGCGRMDAFNFFKINVLFQPDDGSIGTCDFAALWNQRSRTNMWLHWNGSGNDLITENHLSAYPANFWSFGFRPDNFARMTNFIWNLSPPKFPYPIDQPAADRGREVFSAQCAECHAFGSAKIGQTTGIETVATDPYFLGMWTDKFIRRLEQIDAGPFHFTGMRRSNGYLNTPLDGIWMRAPYLHNGSVPTLADLLTPPRKRPKHFYRGFNVYDQSKVGFRSTDDDARAIGSLYETSLPGNSNRGHEWGTELPAKAKRDLIEFLKTF